MKILLTNDDGIDSEGLGLLCQRLSSLNHQVYVVAPDGQRSATAHGACFFKRLYVKRMENYFNATEAYAFSGTPSDCVKFAESVLKIPFDLLVSGPNNGENSGNAILYSGTVGAAEEGVLCGYKSIALSRLGRGGSFVTAVDFLVRNLDELCKISIKDTLLNINVPDLPAEQIRGVRVVKHSEAKLYNDYMEPQTDEPDCFVSTGFRCDLQEKDTDVALSEAGYITVTPLSIVRTNFDAIYALKHLEKRLK
ncbi:MAG: 5'/3'-nucleotidase SurE [Corallococcus sp.]|nr:5'/3'-nucleotidase SurE [Corallococcus sp.]MCM1359685.1 5'/3'-nucleotidase SurE [Corallococcus sp.]MCM1395394.1 5'/3'-nucleotidase SurE [Corallococcus sp.]